MESLRHQLYDLEAQLERIKGPPPALDIEDDEPQQKSAQKAGGGGISTFEPLELDEAAIEAQAKKEQAQAKPPKEEGAEIAEQSTEEEPIFEDPDEALDAEEVEREVDPKYSVTIDRDLIDLMPLFLKARRQEADDYSLWIKMGEYNKIVQTCNQTRGVALTFGFDYLAKLLLALAQAGQKQERKLADKLVFEINFLLDQCHITYV